MLNHPTLDQLKTMKLNGMAQAFEEQLQLTDHHDLSFEESPRLPRRARTHPTFQPTTHQSTATRPAQAHRHPRRPRLSSAPRSR